MKTVEQIKKEITELENFCRTEGIKKAQINKAKSEIEHLRKCILYLQTTPSKDFINKTIDRIKNKIKLIEVDFETKIAHQFKSLPARNKAKKNFFKELDMETLRKHLSTLEYLTSTGKAA